MSGVLTAAMLLTMAPATAFAADDAPAAENTNAITAQSVQDSNSSSIATFADPVKFDLDFPSDILPEGHTLTSATAVFVKEINKEVVVVDGKVSSCETSYTTNQLTVRDNRISGTCSNVAGMVLVMIAQDNKGVYYMYGYAPSIKFIGGGANKFRIGGGAICNETVNWADNGGGWAAAAPKLTVNASNGGSATGSGYYAYNAQATLKATASSGYAFKSWSDGNTDNPRTVTVTADAEYTAQFEASVGVSIALPTGVKKAAGSGDLSQTINSTVAFQPIILEAQDGYTFGADVDLNTLNSELGNHGLKAAYANGKITIGQKSGASITEVSVSAEKIPAPVKDISVNFSSIPASLTGSNLKQTLKGGAALDPAIEITAADDYVPLTDADVADLKQALQKKGLTADFADGKLTISGTPSSDVSASDFAWPAMKTVQAKDSNGGKYASVGDALGKVSTGTITAKGATVTAGEGTLKNSVSLETNASTVKAVGDTLIGWDTKGNVTVKSGKTEVVGDVKADIASVGEKAFHGENGKKYTVDTAGKTLTTDEAGTVEMGNTKFTGAAGDKFQLGKTADDKTTAEIPTGATVEGSNAKIKGVEPAEGKNATKVELDPTTGEPTLVAGKGEVTGEATVKVAVKDKDGNITKTVEVAIPSGKTYTIDADNLPPQVGKLAEGESITLGGIKYTAGANETEFPIGEDKLTNTGDKATVPAGKGAEIALGDGADAPKITVPESNTGATTITKGGTKGDATTPTTVRVPANGKFTLNGKDYVAGNEGATFVVDEENKTASLETGNAAVKAGDSLGVKTGDKVIPVTAADKDIVVKAGDPAEGKSSATVPNGGKVTIGSGDNAKTYPSKEDGTKFTFDDKGNVTLANGTTELGKNENVIGGGSGKNIANAGEGAITVKANDPSGKDTVTVPADGKIKIGDTEYDAGANGATIVAGDESNKLTNGSLKLDNTEGVTVGEKDVPVKNTGDKQIEVKADGTVSVPADGEMEVGSGDKTAKITDVTKDTTFKIGEDGKTNVDIPKDGSVTINGVTYTDDGTGTGKLTIDENGKVSGAENIKAEISEDSLKDPNFEYDLIPGVSVTVGKYTYTAPKDGALGDVTLKARTETTGEGQVTKALNPEITIKKDKGTVEVALKDNKDTKTTYTAANANTKFAMSANDTDTTKVDLLDNKATEAGKNSALKFTDKAGEAKQSHTVNGVTYQGQEVKDKDGKAQDTSYTVSFGEAEVDTGKKDEKGDPIKEKVNRNTVSVDSGSKVSASMNANGTINIGSGKVGEDKFTTDKSFTASNNGASILIDNTDSSNPNQIAGNGNSYVTPIYGKNEDGTDNTKDIKGYQVTRRSSSGGGGGSSSSGGSSIKTGTVKNGTITVSPKSASKDQKVTVTVKPDAGYKLGSLTVTDKNGNKVSLTKKNDNEYTFVMPAGGVTVNGTFVKAGEAADYASCPKDENCVIAKFKDAKPNAWYHDGVHYCLDNGLMVGVTADTFNPNGNITRGQIVTMLWRQAGSPIVIGEKFNDVAASEYYAQAVEWAAANKIVTGYGNGNFGPKKAITREQLAAILYRFAQFKGMDTSVGGMSLNEFADNGSVSDYARTAMQWAISNKIVTGINSTTIDPKGTATRAQAANLMQRFLTELK